MQVVLLSLILMYNFTGWHSKFGNCTMHRPFREMKYEITPEVALTVEGKLIPGYSGFLELSQGMWGRSGLVTILKCYSVYMNTT